MPGGVVGGPSHGLDRTGATLLGRIGAWEILKAGIQTRSILLQQTTTTETEQPPEWTVSTKVVPHETLCVRSIVEHLQASGSRYEQAWPVASEPAPEGVLERQAARRMEQITTLIFSDLRCTQPWHFWLPASLLKRYCGNVRTVIVERSDAVVPALLKFLGESGFRLDHLDIGFELTPFAPRWNYGQRRVPARQITVRTPSYFRGNADCMLRYVDHFVRSAQIIATAPAFSPDDRDELTRRANIQPDPWFFSRPYPTLALAQLESLYFVGAERVPLWPMFGEWDLSGGVLDRMPRMQYVGAYRDGVWLEPLPTHRAFHLTLCDIETSEYVGATLLGLASRPKRHTDRDASPTAPPSLRYLTRCIYGQEDKWIELESRRMHRFEQVVPGSSEVVLFIWHRRWRARLIVTRQRTQWLRPLPSLPSLSESEEEDGEPWSEARSELSDASSASPPLSSLSSLSSPPSLV